MSHRDAYLDATLRHLGAAYYDSLHGRAASGDVTRALEAVADRMGETGTRQPTVSSQAGGHSVRRQHHGQWHSRVRDFMTTSVVTVDRTTPYKEVARLLTDHKVSGLPVLSLGRHVTGIVSEADLIAARSSRTSSHGWSLRWPSQRRPHHGLTAGELMTSPAVTIHPDATVASTARVMNTRHVRRLPVVDHDGKLIGIVSRRDLLKVFLRPDAEIAGQVGEILTEILSLDPEEIKVSVRNGVVTLTMPVGLAQQQDLTLAERLIWDVDGVVDVVQRAGAAVPSQADHRASS
jgi:CBS-domain-containing membrane protein